MTLGADDQRRVDVDGPIPSHTGFYVALAAWLPLALFVLIAATPPSQSADCGFWGCPTNNAFLLWLLLIPATPVTLGLGAWARSRAASVLEDFPDSPGAGQASTALFLARLSAAATIAAWAWLWFWYS